jgi:polyadenylation factor subunit 2
MMDQSQVSVQMAGIRLAVAQRKKLYQPKEYVDFYPSLVRMMEQRLYVNNYRDRPSLQPSRDYTRSLLPTSVYSHCPAACMPTRFFYTLQNKKKNGINSVVWTRDGRRLTTGSKNGEFTFWDAISMKYDKLVDSAEGKPIRSMAWSHSGEWLLSGCHGGIVRWLDPSLREIKSIEAHKSPDGQHTVRDLTWAPFDTKFGTCSDDKNIKIWDVKGKCERTLIGHRWDVKALDWHPTKPLLVSGSKDNSVKLWDARARKKSCFSW